VPGETAEKFEHDALLVRPVPNELAAEAQEVHDDAPTAEKEPGGQGVGDVTPAAQKLPAGHCEQMPEEVYIPAAVQKICPHVSPLSVALELELHENGKKSPGGLPAQMGVIAPLVLK